MTTLTLLQVLWGIVILLCVANLIAKLRLRYWQRRKAEAEAERDRLKNDLH